MHSFWLVSKYYEEEVYERISLDLNINKEKARGVVLELAETRLSNYLIQAVALLTQLNRQYTQTECKCFTIIPKKMQWHKNLCELLVRRTVGCFTIGDLVCGGWKTRT